MTPELQRLVTLLTTAAQERKKCPLPSEVCPDLTVENAYVVQQEVQRALARRRVGWKLGVTSEELQKRLGVTAPVFGALGFENVLKESPRRELHFTADPRIEVEIGFFLDRDLRGPGISADDVLQATRSICTVVDFMDFRVNGSSIRIADVIADNAAIGCVMPAEERTPVRLSKPDLSRLQGEIWIDGERVASGTGAAVMGNPLHAVAWLANALNARGDCLRAGDFVVSGSLVPAVPLGAGKSVKASVEGLGQVSFTYLG